MRLMRNIMAGAALVFSATVSHTYATDVFMETGDITSQPIGHYEFCQRYPDECAMNKGKVKPVQLTQAIWDNIVKVNRSVNTRIRPAADLELYDQKEYWAYPADAGDCEDYVLLKQRELRTKGIPLSALLITVVQKPDGEGHAVLTIRTDRGDFILDNLHNDVLHWRDTKYTYLKRQSTHHSGLWVTIEQPSGICVGSVSAAR